MEHHTEWEEKIKNICFEIDTSDGESKRVQKLLTETLNDTIAHAKAETVKSLFKYVEHTRNCIRNQYEAGEPTEDKKGYRQKFAGKWYQSLPIDKTPKCDCGLDNIIINDTK